MSEQTESYVRWEPLAGLPEHPVAALRSSYDGEKLLVSATYGFGSDKTLILNFNPRAFKAYDEHSDPWMEHRPAQPMVSNTTLNTWVWPLQEVRNSQWLGRVLARDGGIDGMEWRHFVIVSADLCLHIMAVEPDRAELT